MRTTVVIPTIVTNNYIFDLLDQLEWQDEIEHIIVLNNAGIITEAGRRLQSLQTEDTRVEVIEYEGPGIYKLWNDGVAIALVDGAEAIVILNDDIILYEDFVKELVAPLEVDRDIWFVSANWDHRVFDGQFKHFPGTRKDGGLCGFGFAMPAEAFMYGGLKFEERYSVWYGDDDILHQIERQGKKAVMAKYARLDHINGGSNSFGDRCRLVNEENAKDTELYLHKWHNR